MGRAKVPPLALRINEAYDEEQAPGEKKKKKKSPFFGCIPWKKKASSTPSRTQSASVRLAAASQRPAPPTSKPTQPDEVSSSLRTPLVISTQPATQRAATILPSNTQPLKQPAANVPPASPAKNVKFGEASPLHSWQSMAKSTELAEVLTAFNEISHILTPDLAGKLPGIVVIGMQSAGKSSVLQALTSKLKSSSFIVCMCHD